MADIKFRKCTKMFLEGTICSSKYCLEVLHNRKWALVGDENGILKFDTEDVRNTYLQSMQEGVDSQLQVI